MTFQLHLIQKPKHTKVAELHPEVLRGIGIAFRTNIDRQFRSEMGFYPDERQAAQALACALGEAIVDVSADGNIKAVRDEMIAMVDEVVRVAVRGFMMGEHRDG
jgi:hypothetical protein